LDKLQKILFTCKVCARVPQHKYFNYGPQVTSRVRTIPPMPPIPILILNRYRFRYRYRKWRTWYRTGKHWKAEYAICKWLFRHILIRSLLLSVCCCFSQQQANQFTQGCILTCWAGPWEMRRQVGGVTEQACQVIQNASPSQSLFLETVFISVKQSFLTIAYRNSGRPMVPRWRVWAYRGNYWTTTATNQHTQWAVMLCNWLTTHTV